MRVSGPVLASVVFAASIALAPGLPAAPAKGEIVLARVDGAPITLDDLRREFESRHEGHIGLLSDVGTIRDFLKAEIGRRLFVEEARRLELQDEPEIAAAISEGRRKEAAAWLEREIDAGLKVSGEDVAKALEAMKQAREVRLIQVDTLAEARTVREALAGGADPDKLAREKSTAHTRIYGGLERVAWGDKPPQLEHAIFDTAVGSVTEPVETDSGWVVAKVIASEPSEPLEPNAMRARARTVLRARARDAAYVRFLGELRRRHDVRVHEDLLDPNALVPAPGAARPAGGEDPAVATWNGGRILRSELARGIDADRFLALDEAARRRLARQLLDNRLDEALLEQEGVRRWAGAPPDVRSKVNVLEEDLLYRAIIAGFVFQGLDVSDEEVRAEYEGHRDRYRAPVRIELAIALLDTEADARRFLDDVTAGGDFAQLARERSKDPDTAAKGGVAGWVTQSRAIPELRSGPFETPVGGVGGPVKFKDQFLVYKVLDRKEARDETLDEVKDRIREAILDREKAQRMSEWGEKLRARARIEIYEAALRKASERLAAERKEQFKSAEGGTPHPVSPHGGGPH